jgi:RimJ/RimL family protein N-acetyltransferase
MTLAGETDRIESGRLIFRRIEQADFEFFARIHADPIVTRYLGNGKARSIQQTQALLERFYETYKSLEPSLLAVLRKSDGVLIGGLWPQRYGTRGEYGIWEIASGMV